MNSDDLYRHHECNAYCRNGEHCDTFYTSTDEPGTITRMLQDRFGIGVIDVQPAPEAPPLGPDEGVTVVGAESDAPEFPMVVWWVDDVPLDVA